MAWTIKRNNEHSIGSFCSCNPPASYALLVFFPIQKARKNNSRQLLKFSRVLSVKPSSKLYVLAPLLTPSCCSPQSLIVHEWPLFRIARLTDPWSRERTCKWEKSFKNFKWKQSWREQFDFCLVDFKSVILDSNCSWSKFSSTNKGFIDR